MIMMIASNGHEETVIHDQSHSAILSKSRHSNGVMVLPRLIAIALRKYTTLPNERDAAVRMLLRNALRLAEEHIGKSAAASVALETLRERRH